jgi:hypothetical protein
LTASLIALALIPAFYASLSDSLLEIVPKLHQTILSLQKNQVMVSIGRLALTAITMFVFPWAFIAILAAGLPRILGNMQLRKIAFSFADDKQRNNKIIRSEILIIVKRSLPAILYYCLSSQIVIWIISIFGNSNSVAKIGALGRLSILLNILNVLFNTLFVPRFARMKKSKNELMYFYFKILFISLSFSLFFITIIWFFSDAFLWILGKNYLDQKIELLLIIIGTCINLLMNTGLSLYLSRGWIIKSYISILVSVLPIILGCLIFDLSSLIGILYLNIFTALVQMILHVGFGFYKIFNIKIK